MDGKRLLRSAGGALALALVLAAPNAAQAATATATGTISAGSLSLTTSAAPTFSATLDGTDKTPTYTIPTTVTDATGSGAGWNLTITSTQFTASGGKTLATNAATITGVTNACAGTGSCTSPTNSTSYPVAVPAGTTAPAAVKYFTAAANTGLGQFTNTPTVQVSVPATSQAGTYTSTQTLSAVSGP